MSEREWLNIMDAVKEAWANALKVIAAGAVFFMMYLAVVLLGPGIEGRYFPVIDRYRLVDVDHIAEGGYSFRAAFTKERDCTYYGVTWFAQDDRGNLSRVQAGRSTEEPGPPQTGPVGKRYGNKIVLYPPENARALFGINHHDCGLPWQTRTTVGPFAVTNGQLENVPDRSALRP